MLVVRELAVDAASLEGGASAVAVAVAAFALEDFRDAREPRTVARGGAVDDSGNDTLGRRLPLLAAEIVTGPAVGGARVDVTLQRLRVEAEPTFLLDVGRVFVPTLAGGGGEAPEDVLPADVRVRPGEPFRLDADLELGSTRRVLADAVAGASYVLDGGGRSIVVRESELDRGPLVFVGPGATLEIRDARVRVASEDGAETAWASVARLAPGATYARARATASCLKLSRRRSVTDAETIATESRRSFARRRRPFHSIVSIAEPLRAYFPCRFARRDSNFASSATSATRRRGIRRERGM